MTTTIKTAELRGVKVIAAMSEESIAFTGSLYLNGKKAADLKNTGQGGCNEMRFSDHELEKAFCAYCESLPPTPPDQWAIDNGFPEPLAMEADYWISLEVGKVEEKRHWKRQCAKSICVILKSHGDGEFALYKNTPYTPEKAAQIRAKFGEELVEIINERYL